MSEIQLQRRRSIRLPDYDYTRPGAYFITICTLNRKLLFGDVADGIMLMSKLGTVVQDCWSSIPEHFPHVQLDESIVMPNHVHGILVIADGNRRGTACRAPTNERFGRPVSGSIPTVIRSFKSVSTKRINEIRNTHGSHIWQRNYYERVIRNEDELDHVRQYITDNPVKWSEDIENPDNFLSKQKSILC